MDSKYCNSTLLPLYSSGANLIWKLKFKSLSYIDLPEVFRLKLMALNTSYNGLLPINCFPINLKQIKMDNLMTLKCAVEYMVAIGQNGGVILLCKLHWGSAPWCRTSAQNHRYLSTIWGLPRPHGAAGCWLAFSGGQTWRRSCCVGQRSGHYPGLHAPLSGPAGKTGSKTFLKYSGLIFISSLFEKRIRNKKKHRKQLAWSSYPSILARVNWSMLYWAKALYDKKGMQVTLRTLL